MIELPDPFDIMTASGERAPVDAAIEWHLLRDSGRMSADETAAFERWLAAAPENRAAMAEIEAVWTDLRAIPRPHLPAAATGRRQTASWVSRLLSATTAVAAMLLLAAYGLDLPLRLQADAYTATGETKIVTLDDGSTVELNTSSAIAVDFAHERRIRLLRGEAIFTVSKDPSRPFVVAAGGGDVRALGTIFAVHESLDDVHVTVLESQVGVAYPAGGPYDTRLAQGEAVDYSQKGIGRVGPADVETETAWRRGKLIFVDRPLGDVVAELNRYHSGHIQILDSSLKSLRVSGVFSTRNPAGAIDALEASLGLHATRLTRYLVLVHR